MGTTELFLALGALVAGFVSGFAGFGTALFASGIWFAVMPVHVVAPLVILCAFVGQLMGLIRLSKHISIRGAWPLISGGIVGVPIGTVALFALSPTVIKLAIGLFLVIYAIWQLLGERTRIVIGPQPMIYDRLVGFVGGILGGIAGLAGPLPIIWLQLQDLPASQQRARYQPFNLCILGLSCLSLAVFGLFTTELLSLALYAVPLTAIGAWFGIKLYQRTSEQAFRVWILVLLLLSGLFILSQFPF